MSSMKTDDVLIDNTGHILGLLYITSEWILTKDINTRQNASKFVLHLLNDDQKLTWCVQNPAVSDCEGQKLPF